MEALICVLMGESIPQIKSTEIGEIGNVSFTERIKKILPVMLFLPLIILVSSDSALLLVNQVLVICEFNLVDNFAIVGAVAGSGQIALAVSTITFGYLADKYSRKKILIIGGVTWAIGELCVSISPSIYWVLVFRIIASIGAGSTTPVTMSLLSDIFASEKRGNSFAWWGLATTIGGLAGGAIALAFNKIDYNFSDDTITIAERIAYIQNHYDISIISQWRIPFLLMGILGLIFTLIIFLVKEPKRGSQDAQLRAVLANEEVDYSKSFKIKPEDLKFIYARKSNFWLIINFFDTIFSGLVLSYLITWMTLEVGIPLDPNSILGLLPFFLIIVGFLLWGQFYFAKAADKRVKKGDKTGRVKLAIFCGVFHMPFMILGFMFYPNFGNLTLFNPTVSFAGNYPLFYTLFLIMGVIIGIGLGLSFGIAPNWYASMMDVNLPEHRGTMIAAAAFMDAIGRAIGSWVGGAIIDHYTTNGSLMPISDTIIFTCLSFGLLSCICWLPILKYCKHDFQEISDILDARALKLQEAKIQTPK